MSFEIVSFVTEVLHWKTTELIVAAVCLLKENKTKKKKTITRKNKITKRMKTPRTRVEFYEEKGKRLI